MKRAPAEIIREYGPLTDVTQVGGCTTSIVSEAEVGRTGEEPVRSE